MRTSSRLGAALAVVLLCSASMGLAAGAPVRWAPPTVSSAAGAASTAVSTSKVPVFAYFYQWFNPSSWDRAKRDLPLTGKYSSDDPHVLRDQVEAARAAGIDGFLTSWKSTTTTS